MQESRQAPKVMTPHYDEEIHMLEGLEDEEFERYLNENPRIMLFVIDIGGTTETYTSPVSTATHDEDPSKDAIPELRCRGCLHVASRHYNDARRNKRWFGRGTTSPLGRQEFATHSKGQP